MSLIRNAIIITADLRMPQAVSNRPRLSKAVCNRNEDVDQTTDIMFGICEILSPQSAEAKLRSAGIDPVH